MTLKENRHKADAWEMNYKIKTSNKTKVKRYKKETDILKERRNNYEQQEKKRNQQNILYP